MRLEAPTGCWVEEAARLRVRSASQSSCCLLLLVRKCWTTAVRLSLGEAYVGGTGLLKNLQVSVGKAHRGHHGEGNAVECGPDE